MPKYARYPNEPAGAAKKRIAKNKAMKTQEDPKTKSDMMANNVAGTIKNMGGGY